MKTQQPKDFKVPTAIAWDSETCSLSVVMNAPHGTKGGKKYRRWFFGLYSFRNNRDFCKHMNMENGFYHNIMFKDVRAWVGGIEEFKQSKVIIRKSITINKQTAP